MTRPGSAWVCQFLQTFEHLGRGLYKYGLRTEKSFLRPPPQVKEFLPQNPNSETLTYAALRQLVQTFVDDLVKAEATLAAVKDPAVKLPLHVGLIKIDPFGQGKPISAAFLFERVEGLRVMSPQAQRLVIGFNRGDVSWLRGYCHFLAALGELLLAADGQHAFECSATCCSRESRRRTRSCWKSAAPSTRTRWQTVACCRT